MTKKYPLPWKITGNHAIITPEESETGYENYHVVSGNRCICEMLDKSDAVYIVKACNLYPELVETLKLVMDSYISLIESGDCGFWDPWKEPKIAKAKELLEKT